MTTASLQRREPLLDDVQAAVLVEKAVAAAKRLGVRVGAVVVDASGLVLAVRRQADSYPSTVEIARSKAFTAANFGVDTHEMAERLGSVEYAVHVTQAQPGLLFVKGGCALEIGGVLVGGIGVSGASAAQDLECAQAALKEWENRPDHLVHQ
ncbi:heme-binding protein [Pseudarthrobacter sulfonivorans]|uniref:GlcG/HbpS family heme-binding protein n=1 Tax=Pseudarthrobacter sulfonivorans TaxID=121292 RepID=UPI00168B326B|nr:heme-binding protein [Pseudarthrobacter sulfonivorans]